MSFDGEDDYLDLSLSVNNDFSFVGWLNHNQFQNVNNYILESPTGSTIRLSAYGCGSTSLATEWVLGMNGQNTNHCGNTILNANDWFHVAVTQLQDSVRFYVNGQLDYTFYEPIAISRTFAKLGGIPNDNIWNGEMDEVSLWNKSLSQQEIRIL